MKKPLMAALLASAFLAAARSDAAVVYLKDGSRLSGTVVGATARDVQLYTPDGTIRISTDRISSIDYQGAAAPSQAPQGQAAPQPAPPPPVHSRFTRGAAEREELGLNEFSIDLGITAPLSDVDFGPSGGGTPSNGDVGVALGAQFVHYIDQHVGLGVDLEWLDRGDNETTSVLANGDNLIGGDTLLALGILKYDFLARGSVRPYATLGAGIHHTNETVSSQPLPGFVWTDTGTDERRTLVDGSSTGAAGTIRLGVDFHQFDPSMFSFEVGWTAVAGATYHATGAGQAVGVNDVSGPIQLLTVVGRWGWRF